MKITLYCVDKDDSDVTATEIRTVTFSTAAPGQAGTSIQQQADQPTFDALSVGVAYEFVLTLPVAA